MSMSVLTKIEVQVCVCVCVCVQELLMVDLGFFMHCNIIMGFVYCSMFVNVCVCVCVCVRVTLNFPLNSQCFFRMIVR